MYINYKEYKSKFIKKYFCDTESINLDEYNKLEEKDRLLVPGLTEGDNQYFRVYTEKISNDEINNFILMKLLDNSILLNSKMNVIKKIMIFWLVITLIKYIFSFLTLLM